MPPNTTFLYRPSNAIVLATAFLCACGGSSTTTQGIAASQIASHAQATDATPAATDAIDAAAQNPNRNMDKAQPVRIMENLGRGVVAIRTSSTRASISWRVLGLDPSGIAFNLYRVTDGAAPVRLNDTPLTGATHFTDADAPKASGYRYFVRPVIGGIEGAPSGAAALAANGANEPFVRIALAPAPGPGYYSKYMWVGDLDGDGEYDYVIDRLAPTDAADNNIGLGNQYLEAYRRDGKQLWRIDLGPSSRGTYNVRPGAATLSVGMLDGATVADLDGDGRAEVVLKVADGVVFGDGTTFTNADKEAQSIAVIDGLRGVPLATRALPSDFAAQGRLGVQLAVGSVDGVHPSIFFWGRNRNPDKSFNDIFASWSFSGGAIAENWRFPLTEKLGNRASHQMRIIDLDGDGKDELSSGNFAINSNGTLRYVLPGVGHGDRFYIGKFDKDHAGMRGYGIQQDNPSGLLEYYYDATDGIIQWTHNTTPGTLVDVGRGIVGDIDPAHPGYEVWAYRGGVYHGPTNTLTHPDRNNPWPNQQIWWDGDLLGEQLGDRYIQKWMPATGNMSRITNLYASGCSFNGMDNPVFFGDILGDWRTEVACMSKDNDALLVYTTPIPTDTRLYTMAHNPAYRNHMTAKGYMQSPLPDYYLGHGMSAPPRPAIRYAAMLD